MTATAPGLAIIPNVGAAEDGDRVFLDIKAAEGLHLYARHWPGPVRCVSRSADPAANAYGRWYARGSLPFDVVCIGADAPIEDALPHLAGAALVVGGADDYRDRALPDLLPGTPVVMTIEYALRTRLDILRLTTGGLPSRLRGGIWLIRQERRVRRALARSAGLQANGTPAHDAYRTLNANPLLFFDTRLAESDFIGLTGAATKAEALTARRGPIRLAFSGRLERMKGADHLLPVMRALKARGVDATVDIYGDGSLQPAIAAEAAGDPWLAARVRMRGAVDFETALVPALKTETDLFICPHPQGDPSCTYLETLGCGVPIAGFLNPAFRGVLALGPCGVGVRVGDDRGLAAAIAALAADRGKLAALTRGAAAVAATRLFEPTLAARVAHLRAVAGLDAVPSLSASR
ncbi:glycosyltransferase [Sphingomonas sp. ID0503]|uniref:glycosyltransferase n=1 Tax=Sphingomonas sp. ID0503 TaxID=3399691 RepID=UPI003AFA875B